MACEHSLALFLPDFAERAGGGDGGLAFLLVDVEEREVLLACHLGGPDYSIAVLRELVRTGTLLIGGQAFIVGEQRSGERVVTGEIRAEHQEAARDRPGVISVRCSSRV